MSLRFSKKFQNDISLYEPIGTDRDGNEIVMLDVINSETPDFAEQLHLAIESEKMLHAVQERLSKREQIVDIFRYGLWGQEGLTQQESPDGSVSPVPMYTATSIVNKVL